jgi:hypothetical protein
MDVVNHLEKYLGIIQEGIKLDDRKFHVSLSIFNGVPFSDTHTFVTLGLNRYDLMKNDFNYNLELLFFAEKQFKKDDISKFLLTMTERYIETKMMPWKGDVYFFGDYIYPQSKMKHFYITSPVFYPDGIESVLIKRKKVIFPWVFPIHDSEASFINQFGYDAFETLLEEKEVSSFGDLFRAAII